MNMREKIAVALFKVDYPKDDWERLDAGRGSYNQDRYRAKADAVLDALLEPTEGMCQSTGDGANTSRRLFRDMIRAAMRGK